MSYKKTITNKKKTNLKLVTSKKALLIIIFALTGAVFLAFSLASTTIVKVADHPQAINQSIANGKTLHTLKTWQGKIYGGFGDYGANTGPIALTPFDGNNFDAVEIFADTEAIYQFREIGNKLYAISADPKSSADAAVGTYNNGTITWENKRFVGTTHSYDIFTYNGSDLWLVGSKGVYAKAWRSLDGGITWSESLSVANVNTSRTDDFARFYGAIVHNGKIYVQARDFYGSLHPTSKVFDGSSWSDGPSIGNFNSCDIFAGKSICHGSFHIGDGWSRPLYEFNGSRFNAVSPNWIYNYTIDGDTLYVLTSNSTRTVYKTKDLVNWTEVGPTSSIASSLSVLNGVIYIGGTDGAIYKLQSTNPDTTPPNIQFISPISGQTVSGTIPVSVSVTDDNGVASVEFTIAETSQVIGTDTTSPYSIDFDTTQMTSGAYNIQATAIDTSGNSKSISLQVNIENQVGNTTAADLNNDTVVDIVDLSILLSDWGESGVAADINEDGIVDIMDLSVLLSNWT